MLHNAFTTNNNDMCSYEESEVRRGRCEYKDQARSKEGGEEERRRGGEEERRRGGEEKRRRGEEHKKEEYLVCTGR